ncbi:MAG: ABC transporter ATP-binding protein [Flavobacteriaceae bacterium]
MLAVHNLTYAYNGSPVLRDINFAVKEGEHLAIIGESGCGKSTLLNIIYGLLHLEKGEVSWKEKKVMGPLYNLVPGEGHMKYLTQQFDLMPYTTVYENISQHLSAFEPEHLRARTQELLKMIELEDFSNTKVKDLSGGQQQRVALARVLAQEPEVLLLDEPFSHIDHLRKNRFRKNFFYYLRKRGITVLTATHDPFDVLPYANKVLVLKDHAILAEGTPKELYDKPQSLYVASLFGEASTLPVQIVKSYADTKRHIIVYSHELKVSEKSGMEVKVATSYFMGSHYMVVGRYEDYEIYFDHHTALEPETKVFLNVSLETINRRLVQ